MKRRLLVFLQVVLLLLCVPVIAAAADISLDCSKNTAPVGESVTVFGKTTPNTWVPIKIIDASQNIVVFDAQKADANGNYSINFKVPTGASGTLTVVVGEGSNVANKNLTIRTELPADTKAPTWTTGSTLKATNITQTGLTLTWDTATDNIAVTKYRVYKDGSVIDTVNATTTYNVTGLSSATNYTFKVEAGDAAGNWSTSGPSTTVTTKSSASSGGGGGGGALPKTQPDVSKDITAITGGTVSYQDLTVEIPAGALPGNARVSISKLTTSKANEVVSEGMRVKLGSDVYEIKTTGSSNFGDKTISIKIPYDPAKITKGETAVIQYYDENAKRWVSLETTMVQENGKWHAVTHVNHLTKFAVFSTAVKVEEPAPAPVKVINLTIGQVAASVGGNTYTMDAAPYVDSQVGRTLVPLRFVSEGLGAGVNWNADTKQVAIIDEGKEIVLTLGSKNVLVNGQTTTIDCNPAMLPPGRTVVPLRFVSETLGAQVDYDAVTKEITINR